jgi:short-subunit dehydrogenase
MSAQEVTLITGASDGIGAELALQLAALQGRQAALVLAGRSADKLQAVAARCQAHGAQVLCVAGDLRQEDACRQLVRQAIAHFGALDTLVNNAGISAHAELSEVRAQDLGWYRDLMDANFWSAVWCTHEALPQLRARRGRLVAVSSLAGLIGVPGRSAYSASKFALGGFMEAVRAETPPEQLSVTVAYPGVVDTQIRYRGYNAQGQAAGRSGLREEHAMPVQVCARLILQGMRARRREVVMTARGRLGRWLKLLAPAVVERMARAALTQAAR